MTDEKATRATTPMLAWVKQDEIQGRPDEWEAYAGPYRLRVERRGENDYRDVDGNGTPHPDLVTAQLAAEALCRARLPQSMAGDQRALDALTAHLSDDGGEALPDLEPQYTPFADPIDGEVWRGRVKVDDDWAHAAVVLVDGQAMPRFFAFNRWRDPAPGFGYKVMAAWARASRAAGRAEGEAERARLQALVDKAYTEVAGEIVASDRDVATIARLRTELAEARARREESEGTFGRIAAALGLPRQAAQAERERWEAREKERIAAIDRACDGNRGRARGAGGAG